MAKPKIVIVGGGSNAWTPAIVKDILLTESLRESEIVLYDIDKKASDLCKAYLDKLTEKLGLNPKIVSTDKIAPALKGADYILITISTGKLPSMAHDLAIPEDYSVYHTVGDTSGPGGWARTIRNYGAFVELANAFNRYVPDAMILNYTNPMTTLTNLLCRLCKGPVVGLCHGVFEVLDVIKSYYKLESEDEIAVKYAGINHFFWITEAKAGKIDVIADFKKEAKKKSLTYLKVETELDAMGFGSDREIATELFLLTGALPYLGDRHTSEFFPQYITSKKNIKKYKLRRTSIKHRKDLFNERNRQLCAMIKGKEEITGKYIERSRETAADIINAHFCGEVFIDVGNVPNIGQVSNLPKGLVVETPVRVDRNGFSPICFGDLPECAAEMIRPWATVFTMTVDACMQQDKEMALQALRLDPTCSHLTTDKVIEMGNRLLKAHKKYIKCF